MLLERRRASARSPGAASCARRACLARVLVVGREAAPFRFIHNDAVVLVQHVDGLRTLASSRRLLLASPRPGPATTAAAFDLCFYLGGTAVAGGRRGSRGGRAAAASSGPRLRLRLRLRGIRTVCGRGGVALVLC